MTADQVDDERLARVDRQCSSANGVAREALERFRGKVDTRAAGRLHGGQPGLPQINRFNELFRGACVVGRIHSSR